jgi:hypothetical protein
LRQLLYLLFDFWVRGQKRVACSLCLSRNLMARAARLACFSTALLAGPSRCLRFAWRCPWTCPGRCLQYRPQTPSRLFERRLRRHSLRTRRLSIRCSLRPRRLRAQPKGSPMCARIRPRWPCPFPPLASHHLRQSPGMLLFQLLPERPAVQSSWWQWWSRSGGGPSLCATSYTLLPTPLVSSFVRSQLPRPRLLRMTPGSTLVSPGFRMRCGRVLIHLRLVDREKVVGLEGVPFLPKRCLVSVSD